MKKKSILIILFLCFLFPSSTYCQKAYNSTNPNYDEWLANYKTDEFGDIVSYNYIYLTRELDVKLDGTITNENKKLNKIEIRINESGLYFMHKSTYLRSDDFKLVLKIKRDNNSISSYKCDYWTENIHGYNTKAYLMSFENHDNTPSKQDIEYEWIDGSLVVKKQNRVNNIGTIGFNENSELYNLMTNGTGELLKIVVYKSGRNNIRLYSFKIRTLKR